MGSWLHAEGLNVGVTVRSGLDVEIGNQHSGAADHPVFTVRHFGDPHAAEVNLSLSFARDNFGFLWMPGLYLSNHSTIMDAARPNQDFFGGNMLGWFTLADDMVRVTVGRMNTTAWTNFGATGRTFSQGTGMRLEIMPMDGLNAGFFLRANHHNYRTLPWLPGEGPHPDNQARLSYALANTSFGARFAPADGLFGIAAGLELRSQFQNAAQVGLDPIWDSGFYWNTLFARSGSAIAGRGFTGGYGARGLRGSVPEGVADRNDFSALGVNAYVGAGLNLLDDLSLEFGVDLFRLDDFNHSGLIWLHQSIGFDVSPLQIGLDMHQVIFSGYESRDAGPAATDRGPIDIALQFIPNVGFDITDDTRLAVAIPIGLTPGWSRENYTGFSFGFEPTITQRMGEGFTIGARYILDYNNQGGVTGGNNEITNRLGVQFVWSF
jgi:hypothetical protein